MKRRNCSIALSVLIIGSLLFGNSAVAEVRLPSVIGEHMILQQETGAPIWGWATPGEKVKVDGSWGEEETAIADTDGNWMVMLQTPSYGGPYGLSIEGKNRIELSDVMIGEVWLCAGQSNMGWRLGATFEGKEDGDSAEDSDFRIFRAERSHNVEPQNDCVGEWKRCTPVSAEACSAVSFYFARKLREELGIPVGIVIQPYAGTPIEGWMPKDIQMGDPRTRAIIENMDTESASYHLEKATAQLERSTALWKAGKRRGEPKLRTPSNWRHQYPGNIFNGMINPVRPYGIRGAIWYQGERNAKDVAQAANCVNQLPMLIDYYRSSWHEESKGNVADDFPFYFVQLPSWHPRQTEPVEADAAWAVSRDMMRRVARDTPNTGVAVIVDTGDEILLHPKDKKPAGLRLAYLALKQTYGKELVDYGPFYRSHRIESDRIVLEFDSVGSGLMAGRKEPLNGFAIAGEDQAFIWADAEIRDDTIVVSAKGLKKPVAVRYAWAMNPSRRNLLYNNEGIPASPFRTDDWPLLDADNYQPKDQLKPATPEGYEAVQLVRPPMTQ